jgi:cytochrome P450
VGPREAAKALKREAAVQFNRFLAPLLAERRRAPGDDLFDIDRATKGQLGYGFGQHFCLGAHLARVELVVGLEVLLERLPSLRPVEEPRFVGCVIRGPENLRVTLN